MAANTHKKPTRRSLVVGAALGAAALVGLAQVVSSNSLQMQTAHPAPPRFVGVNLPGGSFAAKRLPGVYGKDYAYPSGASAAPFLAIGMNTVRVAVLWERLQPIPGGPLDPAELRRLDDTVSALSGFRAIIIDLHNYARYRGQPLDVADPTGSQLADFWTRVATHYRGNQRIWFGLMNEPHNVDAATWRRIAEVAVAAIRRAGSKNMVLVPGTRWTGGHSWLKGSDSNAKIMDHFRDPGGNFAFEIHQYLDADSSGTHMNCSGRDAGPNRLQGVTQWLRQQHARGFLAEFGTPPDQNCLDALDQMLSFVDRNGDVWLGWTYWAAGERWGKYPFNIQPTDGVTRPQTAILRRHIR